MLATLLLQAQAHLAPGEPTAAGGGPGAAPAEASDFRVFWKDGFRMETADGSIKARFGGRVHFDYAYIGNNEDIQAALGTPLEDGADFRRARMYASGVFMDHIGFKAQYDFAPARTGFRDAYLELLGTPWGGNFRVGQYKEPWSLEEQTSSNYITFMERSVANAFSPIYSTGAMQYNDFADGRMTYAVGVFREYDERFGLEDTVRSDADWSVTGRLTGLPWYENDGERLLHLGVSASQRATGGAAVFGSRPESSIAPTFVSVAVPADEVTNVGVEAAFQWGRFGLQGEYIMSMVDANTGSDPDFMGYYLQGNYFLCGCRRPYNMGYGVFDRVHHPGMALVGQDDCGAWELKARYSALDLDDAGFTGGELADVTVGVNWYITSNVRWMLEAINADIDGVDSTQIVQARWQFDF